MNKLFGMLLLLCFGLSAMAYDWKGQWISTERSQSQTNEWLAYRKTFTLSDVPAALTARIAADSKYWMWINDRLVVFEGGLKRGPAPGATYFDEVEIAPWLKPGQNTVAVLVWHFGKSGFSHASTGRAGLLFDAQSPAFSLVSDASWRCTLYTAYENTSAPHPNFRLPESNIRFDAQKEIKDWHLSSFKGNLPQALVLARAEAYRFGKLVARPIPVWKDYGLRGYEAIRKSANGDTLFCRLPYNCHVTPYLHVEAEAGKTIGMLTDNYEGGSEKNVRGEYVTRAGEQTYESLGWMNGHEVIYIIPDGVVVKDVKYRETGYNADFAGSFSSDDPFLNELWKRSARTLYVTMRDTYMDCPDRERAQWWGDEVNELGEAFYALDPRGQKLALKGIYELMNWQRGDGVIFSPVPSVNWGRELPLQMLASVGYYGFYTQYFYSGDSTFVPVIYDRLHRYLHEVWQPEANGLVTERSGDWNWGDWGEHVDMGVLTNCWYYLALKAELNFAAMLGKEDDVRMLTGMMNSFVSCFNTKYWNGLAYRSPGYKGETDDRAQAMAVVSGLAAADKYPALLQVFKKEYHASPYMEKYVLEALFRMGEADFALSRMKDRYSKMMGYKDYTTLFEGWGIGADGFGGGTINHAWSGGPLTILSQLLCGIEPTSPGFKTFKIAPRMGSVGNASAKVSTHHGLIEVTITRKGKAMTIHAVVPPGTEAEICFPNGKRNHVTAGSHLLKGRAF